MTHRNTVPPRAALALLLLAVPLARRTDAAFQLRDDDRVVFFGDTLVEDQLFSRYVETFVRVRYPKLRTQFVNSGISGQAAADGLRRLDRDLGSLQPTLVVVCFGLHDPDLQPLDPTRLASFRKSYTGILDGVDKLGARMVLVTPPRPVAERLRQIGLVDYDRIVGRYAEIIKELGAARQVAVVDWYGLCGSLGTHLAESLQVRGRPQQTNLRPPTLAHAMLAASLLQLWQAQPIHVEIDLEWSSGTASVSQGTARISDRSDHALTVLLEDLPLPWPLPGLREKDELSGWPGSELCRFVLRVHDPPPAGLHLEWRSKQFPFDAPALAKGIDIGHLQPLRLSRAYRDVVQQIDKKHRWRRHRIVPRRPEAPELQEAYETYIKAMELYEEGTTKIILRLPKTFDTRLQFRVNLEDASESSAPEGN